MKTNASKAVENADEGNLTEEQKFDAFMKQVESEAEGKQEEEPQNQPSDPADDNKPASTPAEGEPFAGFSSLPPEVQASIKAKLDEAAELQKQRNDFENRWKAQAGQLAPIQRQNAELQAAMRKLSEQQRETTRSAITPERLKQFRESFPEESEVILGLVNPLAAELEEFKQQAAMLAQGNRELHENLRVNRELSVLTQHRPTWQQDLPVLEKWIDMLDPEDREEAVALRNSPNAKENVRLWRWFEREEQLGKAMAEVGQPSKSRKPRDVDPNPRNRQSVPLGNANALSGEEEAWAQFVDAANASRRR